MNTNNQVDTPEFNAAIDYLQTISMLKKTAHKLSIMKDYEGLFVTIKQFQIEVMGRVRCKQYKDFSSRLKEKERVCTNLMINKNMSNEFFLHKKLLEWFEEVIVIMHELKLVMPDTGNILDVVSEI